MEHLHHSAAVHIPLALAVLFPLLHLLFLALVKINFLPHRIWLVQWGLAGIQVLTNILSYVTGRRDQAFSAASADLMVQHRELAYSFTWIWVAIFLVYPLVAVSRGPKWRSIMLQLILLSLLAAQLAYAVRLGQIGGKLVFGE